MEEILAFDIETYAAWDDMDPALRDYLAKRERNRGSDDPVAAAAGRTAFMPGVAQVIAIGLWAGDGAGTRLSLVPNLGKREERSTAGDYELVRCKDEADLLRVFWERVGAAVGRGGRLVTFNGRRFDGPILMIRSAVLGVHPSVNLSQRNELQPHCDLCDVLTFFGASRGSYGLEYWCHVFGVPSPKGDMDGSQVGGAFERGEYDAISRYALGDAMATGKIFRRLEQTVLPVLEAPAV